jgi:DNA-binding MarR family transcriptional regulator
MDAGKTVLVALRRIIQATDFNAKLLARQTELTTSQLLVLQLLEGGQSMTIGDLARQVNLNQATVTAVIDRLEGRDFVERHRGQEDRRKVFVSLSKSGQDALEQAPRLLQSVFLDNFGKLADWEQTYVLSAVERIAHLMNAAYLDASPVLDIGPVDRSAQKIKNAAPAAPKS